jgi:hypothetical protein
MRGNGNGAPHLDKRSTAATLAARRCLLGKHQPARHFHWSQINLKIFSSFIISVRGQVLGTRKSHMAFEFRGTLARHVFLKFSYMDYVCDHISFPHNCMYLLVQLHLGSYHPLIKLYFTQLYLIC